MTTDSPLLNVTMTREAAERFKAALRYADALCSTTAEANEAPAMRTRIEEHGDWLRWGISRVQFAEQPTTSARTT